LKNNLLINIWVFLNVGTSKTGGGYWQWLESFA
jgi:hypothetical protein